MTDKQLPQIPQPIQAFKSSLNIKRDKESQVVHIQNKVPIRLEANTSIFALIEYKHDYANIIPFIYYNIVACLFVVFPQII